jgi:hypothetical protein
LLSSLNRQFFALFTVALLFAASAQAFNFPLSIESIREAYFLGQRRDETTARYLDTYSKHLKPPKSGPYISSVRFFTPFAQLVQISSEHTSGYSAQQAQQDHRGHDEIVEISVEIELTPSYGPILTDHASSRSSSPVAYRLRSAGFWTDFQVHVFQGETFLEPVTYTGKPKYSCSEGGCTLYGATIALEFPASTFDSDSATVEVLPPEGEPIAVDFDLTRLR